MNGRSEKFSEQYKVKKLIQAGTRHDEFRGILLKFDFRVCGKAPGSVVMSKLLTLNKHR